MGQILEEPLYEEQDIESLLEENDIPMPEDEDSPFLDIGDDVQELPF